MSKRNILAAFAAVLAFFITPTAASAQSGPSALVYCPASAATACSTISTALVAKGFTVDKGFDGSNGTVNLSSADLQHYAVLVVPSLSGNEYDVLRGASLRLAMAFRGRAAVYSGTPDLGSTNRSDKDALIGGMASWAAAGKAFNVGLGGVVAFQDATTNVGNRYNWVHGISSLDVSGDAAVTSFAAVQTMAEGSSIIGTGSYANMASSGLHIGNRGSSRSLAGASAGTGADRQTVLVYYSPIPRGVARTAASANLIGGGASFSTSGSNGPVIYSSKGDYVPGETAIIYGAGFGPNDAVSIDIHEDPQWNFPDRTITATADANGNFSASFVVQTQDLNVTFTATAVGEPSGLTAQTHFTDSGNSSQYTVSIVPNVIATSPTQTAVRFAFVPNGAMGSLNVALPSGFTYVGTPVMTPSANLAATLKWSFYTDLSTTTPDPTSGYVNFKYGCSKQIGGSTTSANAPTGQACTQIGNAALNDTIYVTVQMIGSATPRSTNIVNANPPTTAGGTDIDISADNNAPGNNNQANLAMGAGSTLTVSSRYATTLTVAAVSGQGGSNQTLTATLKTTASNTAVSGATVELTLNGVSVGSGTTDANGVVTISTAYLTTTGLSGGTNIATGTYTYGTNSGVGASYVGDGVNYLSTTGGNTLTVTQPTVTTFTIGGSATYDGAGHTATITPSLPGCTTYTVVYKDANNNVVATPTKAGTYSVTVTAGGGCTGSSTGSYTISPKAITGSYTAANKAYDATATASLSAPSLSGAVSGDAVSLTGGAGSFADANVGTGKAVTVSGASLTGADAGNYTLGTVTANNANITAAPVTATAGSGSFTYDGTAKSPTACAVTGAYTTGVTCSNTPASQTAAGTYTITPSVSGANSNFSVTPVNGTLTIAQVQATASATNGGGVYTGTAYTGSGTCSNGLTPVITYANTTAPVNVADAGGFTVSCGDGNQNYITGTANGTITITAAAVTATAGSGSNVYDAATHSPTACSVSGSFSLTCANSPATVGPNAGTTVIAPVISAGSNFTVTSVNGSYTISQKQATATATNGGGVYTGTAYTGSGTCSNGLTPVITYANTTAPVNVADAGGFTVSCGDGNQNYITGTANGTITITAAAVTATAGSGSNVYDAATHSPAACSVSGSFSLTCTNSPATVGPNVGTTVIAPVISAGSNFTVTSVNGSYTISQKQATASATNGGGVYTGTAYTGSGTCSNGLTPVITYANTTAPVNVADAGGFTVSCGDGNQNYITGTANGTITITAAAVTATAGSGSNVYDAATHSPTACSVSGSFSLTCTNSPATVGPNVGTTVIAPVISAGSNFTVTSVGGSYTISQKQAVASATNASGSYNGAAHPGSGSCSDGLTASITYANGSAPVNVSDAGGFTVTCGDGNQNYITGTANGTVTISAAAVTATAGSGSVTYNGSAQSPSDCAVTGTYTTGVTCSNSPASQTNAGTYTITPSVSGASSNFAVTPVNGSFEIAQAAITATASTYSTPFSNTAHAGSGTCSAGAAGSAGSYAPGGVAPTNGGTYTYVWTCPGDANHLSATANGTITITPLTLIINPENPTGATILVTGYTGTYDGAVHASTGSATGAFGENLSSLLHLGNSYTNAPGGASDWTFDGNMNYAPSNGSVAIVITPAPVTATAGNGHVTYDGNAQSPSACAVTGTYTAGVSCTNSPASQTNAGNYTITPSVSGASANFAVTPVSGSLIIDRAASSASADPITGTYSGSAFTGTGSCTNSAAGSVTSYSSGSAPIAAGSYTYVWTCPGDANHNSSTANGTIVIGKASSSVTVTAAGGTYNGSAIGGSASVNGAGTVTGSATLSYSGRNGTVYGPSATAPTAAGDYTLTGTYAGDANHDGSSNSADYTIAKASSTTALVCSTVTYNGLAQTPCTAQATGAGSLSVAVSPVTYSNNILAGTGSASATYAGDANHTGSTGNQTFAINKASVTVTASSTTVVYGDPVPTITPSFSAFQNGETNAVLTAQPTCTTAYTAGANAGTYASNCSGATASNYSFSYTPGVVTVTTCPAGPVPGSMVYTGSSYFWTTSSTTSTATLTLTATISAGCDGAFVDVRTAKVTFGVMNGSTFNALPSGTASVGLVDPNNKRVGTATAIVQYDIGKDNSQTLNLGVVVNGNFYRFNTDDQTAILVAKPGIGNTINVGGKFGNSLTGGFLKGSIHNTNAADDSSSVAGFVTYNKSGTNPQGSLVAYVHSPNMANGQVDPTGKMHTYMIKTNAISTLSFPKTGLAATFAGKCTVTDVTDGGAVAVDGGATFQFSFDNTGLPVGSSNASLLVTSSKGGTTWYSSNFDWTTGRTLATLFKGVAAAQ